MTQWSIARQIEHGSIEHGRDRVGHTVVFLMLALASVGVIAQKSDDRVAIFVTSPGAINGLTDPNKDNSESAKDLMTQLKRDKGIRLVTSASEAAVVVTVINRERQAKAYVLFASMKVGDTVTQLRADEIQGFDYAALRMGQQIRQWVKENRGKLNASPR